MGCYCEIHYVSNGRYCSGCCRLPHRTAEDGVRICTPTYTDRICHYGFGCKFRHFLNPQKYCHMYLLFGTCTNIHCPYIHITNKSFVYNLMCINIEDASNIYYHCVNRYINSICGRYWAEFNYMLKQAKQSKETALFRTTAECVICNSIVTEPLNPMERYQALVSSPLNNKLPADLIQYIYSFIVPSTNNAHTTCYFVKGWRHDPNVLKIYKKQLVRVSNCKFRVPRPILIYNVSVVLNRIDLCMLNVSHIDEDLAKSIARKYLLKVRV